MPYRLSMEVMNNAAVETFEREFPSVQDAKGYAEAQANSAVNWTERDTYLDGLCPGYAFRIEEFAEE